MLLMVDNTTDFDASGLNLGHLNVASILGANKFEMLRQQIKGSTMHVFCASETWLNAGVPDGLVHIEGFKLSRLDRSWRDDGECGQAKKGGGLICYVKDHLNFNDSRYA